MYKKLVLFFVVAGILATGATVLAENVKLQNGKVETDPAVIKKVHDAVEANTLKVQQDLEKNFDHQGYVEVRYDHMNQLLNRTGVFSNLSVQESQKLGKSMSVEAMQYLEKGDWIPFFFVKTDGSEYVIAEKKVDGTNIFAKYQLQNDSYVLTNLQKMQGLRVDNNLKKQ